MKFFYNINPDEIIKSLPQPLSPTTIPTFAGLILTGFNGVLKATAGVVSDGSTTSDLPEGTNLYFTDERADDRVASLLQNGSGLTWTYDDAGGTLTPSIDHGGLNGLSDDDHSQYFLLAGRAGGQTLIGGTSASNNLTFQTTSNASKGSYIFSEATASRLASFDSGNGLVSVSDLTTWVSGTSNQITVTNDGDGTVTLQTPQDINTTSTVQFSQATLGNTGLIIGSSTPFSDSSGTLTLQNVDALDVTTEATIESAIDTLANLTSVQGHTISFSGSLTVESNSVIDQDLSSDSTTVTFAGLTIGSLDGVLKASSGVVAGSATTSDLPEGSNLYFTDERVDDRVSSLLQDASGLTWTYNDVANTLTPAIDHGGVNGLGDDDHTQYLLLLGRSGGQTVIGGTGAGDDITFQTTSNVSKGSYIFSEATASRLSSFDSSKGLVSVSDLTSWIAGTTNRVTVSDDGDGTVTLTAPQDINTTSSVQFSQATLGNTGLIIGASTPFSDSSGTLTLQNVDALDATTEATVETALDTLPNVTSVQGQTLTLSGSLNVESASILNQDLTTDGTPTFASETLSNTSGRVLTCDPSSGNFVSIGRSTSGSNVILFDFGSGQALSSTANISMNIDSDNNDTNRYFEIASHRAGFSGGVSIMRAQEDGDIGFGTTSPGSTVSVNGNLAVGSSYATSAAQTDGAIIEGVTYIGTTFGSTSNKLGISGSVAIGSTFKGSGAPSDGLIVEGETSIGRTDNAAKLDVEQESSSADIPVLRLEQTDIDKEFVNWYGTSASDNSRNISTGTSTGSLVRKVKCSVRDGSGTVNGWLYFYDS